MLLDDPLERGRIALAIPGTLRIHERDRTALADPEAIRLRPQDAALIRQSEFLQALLQEVPRGDPAFLVAALRGGLIGAEENMAACYRYADGVRDLQL